MTPQRVRLDMHMHTYRSHDCRSRPEDVVRVAAERGLDHIAVTDHNEIRGALESQSLDPDRVIVGEEVKTREGFDIIGLFLERLIPKGTPAADTCHQIRAQGGVVYLPHPFDGSRTGAPGVLESLIDLIDVVEVHNARCWPISSNARALEWATQRGKLVGGGSDAHTLAEIGRGFVELPRFTPDRDAFLAALTAGTVGGVNTGPVFRLASTWAKIANRLAPPPIGAVPQRGAT